MAFFTFGEGYHNFHHEFQHDYRNGVKPWQFDPTKWTIWLLAKFGLARNLRTVPEEKILKAQIAEQERRLRKKLESHPTADAIHGMLESARSRMHEAVVRWETLLTQYREAKESHEKIARSERRKMQRNVREAADHLRHSIREWIEAQRSVLDGAAVA
jgi:stearoyl-CoA desaturase (delta-9 desaturase)